MAGVTASFVCSLLLLILSTLLLFHDVLAHTRRSCPTEKFCPIGANCTNNITLCVTVCPTEVDHMQQGNWISGNCERIPQGTIYWMDSTFYEIFILTNQTVNSPIRMILFISSESFQTNNGTNVDLVEDITFTLNGSCPYFYFEKMSKTEVIFENYYDLYIPDVIEMTALTLAEPIPPDDYEMQLSVTSSGNVLETRDIVVHVTRDPRCPEPPCPVQDTLVAFTFSDFIVSESAGSLVVILESSGTIQSQSFTVYVIVEANNSTAFPATDGADFTSGRYNATFTLGATTTTTSIPIIDDTIYEPNVEQFNLRLYIDGAGYQLGLYKGNISKATVSILEDTTVRFNQSTYVVDESNGVIQPVLVLSNPLTNSNITLTIIAVSGTATEFSDYNPGLYSVIFPAGMTSVSFDIQIADDNILEDNESFTLNIINSSLPSGITASTPSQATVIIRNDDLIVEFATGQFVGSESSGFIEVIVTATGRISSIPITVTVTPSIQSPVSARGSGIDFNSNPLNVTIDAGANEGRANISVTCDNIVEESETFDIRLTIIGSGFGVMLRRDIAQVLITDSTVVVNFDQSTYGVMESDSTASVVILLSQPSSIPFQVVINTIDVIAEDIDDYSGGLIAVNVSSGVLSQSFRIAILEDNIVECSETFNVSITSISSCGVTIGTNDNSEVIITDNDRAVVSIGQVQYLVPESNKGLSVFVTLSAITSEDVTVGINISDISTNAGLDYELSFPSVFNATIPAGMTSLSGTVDIINDMIHEDNEAAHGVIRLFPSCLSLSLGVSSAIVTIIDDDDPTVSFEQPVYSVDENDGPVQLVLNLSIPSSFSINLQIITNDNTAMGTGIDYDSAPYNITFPPGITRVSFSVPITDDDILENNEDFHLIIVDGSLPNRVTSGDIKMTRITIVDEDDVTISFNQSQYSIVEGNTPLKPSLVLSNPSSTNITIRIANIDDTATRNVDYTSGSYNVIFPAGITSASFDVSIIDDNILESNETFSLNIIHHLLPTKVTRGNPKTSTVTIVDDDMLIIEFSSSSYADFESSGNISVTLLLKGGISSTDVNVTVMPSNQSPLSAEGGKDYISAPITATFTAGTTSTTINVPISNDNETEETETFDLNIIVPYSLDGRLILGDRATAISKIIDNSKLIVEFASSRFTGKELAGSINVVITKSDALSNTSINAQITLTPISAIGSGVDFDSSPLMITFTPGEINKTVAIPVMCDRLIEGEEMFNINLNIISVSNNVTVELGLNRSIGIIIDSTVDVTFAQSTYTIIEDIISLTPLIKLSQASPVSLEVSIKLIDVTTTEADYDQQSISVTIAPGNMAQQFSVNITNDNIIECTEMFNLSISIEKTLCGLNSSNSNAQVIIVDDDAGAVNIMFDRQPPLLVAESAGSLEINLLLNATASKDITILTSMTDITASVGLDYSQNELSSQLTSSVNIINGLMSGLIQINIIDNTIQEPNETFNVALQLQSSCLPISLIGEDSFTITIVDDEELTVEFNQTTYYGREASGVIIVTLSLFGGTASINFNVSVSTSPVTATGNIDYDTATLSATFLAGSTIATVEIPIVDDTVVNEEDELFNLTINLLPTTDVRAMSGIHSTATAIIIDTTRPQIYVHPMDKTVEINNNSATATFNCMGYGASSYYWQKETGDIPSNAIGIKSNRLVLHNILPPDSGNYQCIAENEHGKTYSNYAMFTVKALPPVVSIVSEREVKVKEGERVEIVCSATGVGTNNFIYKWYLNDLPITGQDKPTLVIGAVSEDNTGDYKCFVRNQYNGVGESEVAKLILDRYCNPITVNYIRFNITWNETLIGTTVEAPCTGRGLNGTVRRRCIRDDQWEEFFECFKEETAMLLHQATNLTLSLNELNETEKIAKTSNIANALVNITAPTQESIFPQDINLAINIVSTLNNVTGTIVANLTADDAIFEDTATVIDNLLSDANRNSWKQLERTSPSTSQTLVSSAEQVSKLLSEALTNDTTVAIKAKPNIVIKAERVSNDSVDKGYSFPDENDNLTAYGGGSAQLMVSSSLLQDITTGSKELTIASIVIRNGSGLRLPSSNNETVAVQVPASPIFSLQINPLPDPNVLAKNPIMMMFDVDLSAALSEPEQSDVQNNQDFTIDDLTCNFYDYTLITNNLNQIGGWSTEGLTVDKNHSTKTSATCLTRHLTSFAVLVSIQDERPPSTADKALSIISYIGCSISLACLCISITFLSYAIYKTRDKKNLLFIHLNLCIALALGLVVFIAGIESATSNKIGCKFVAALLQYLFTSAFCWMLCEGIMLYMMLVTVFGNKLNKRRFFFVLGWGPAIPIVVISAGIVHTHYGTDHYCWIKSDDGAIAAFIVPIVAIMLVNCIFFVITLKVLWVNQRQTSSDQIASNKDTVKDLLKAMIVLLPLLGLTWIIGILAVNNETQIFAWIFAILNSLQGVFIFIFHVIRNKQVIREMRERYNLMKRSEAFRRLLSVRGGTGSTSTFGISSKARTSHSTSSEVSGHGKKISTTSFGSCTTGGEYLSATLERSLKDKSELIEDSVFVEENDQMKLTTFKKLDECIMEEHNAGVKETQPNHNEKSITEDDAAIVAEKKYTAPTVKEKPVPLPRIAK